MKRLIALLCLATVTATASAASTFWEQMTPDERRAAGVDQLSPEQRAALDAAAAHFARESARQAVEVVKAETVAVVQQAREEAKAEAKAEAKVATHQMKIAGAGLAAREDDEIIRTRIVGDFRGWKGRTVFTLENGQVWQQSDGENRFFPKMVNPEVELIPSQWAGWKLRLVAGGLWIKVKRVR